MLLRFIWESTTPLWMKYTRYYQKIFVVITAAECSLGRAMYK